MRHVVIKSYEETLRLLNELDRQSFKARIANYHVHDDEDLSNVEIIELEDRNIAYVRSNVIHCEHMFD